MTALAVCICVAWMLPGLVGHDPWKPDEAYTFGLVYHLLQGGGFTVPMLAGEPFVEKPPLYFITAAFFARAFAWLLPLHDGARLASGFYVGLAILFVGGAGRELHGRGRGWVSALIVAGSLGLLVRGHQMITDTALFTGFAAGAYGLALALRRPLAGGVWLGVGVGVGFLAKGLLAPGVLGLAALALPCVARAWRTRSYAGTLAVAAACAAPLLAIWPAALYRESPALFYEWFVLNNFGRFFGWAGLGPKATGLFYMDVLPWHAWPAFPLALWVLWGARVAGFARPAIQLPVVLFLPTLAVLGFATDGRELYALPMLVPLALLATPAVDTLRRGAAGALYWFAVMGFTLFAGVLWIYWSALELGMPAKLSTHLHTLQPGYTSGVRWIPLVFSLFLCTAWIALLARIKRAPERPVIVWAAGMALVWGMLMSLFVGYFDTGKSYRSMIVSLAQAVPSGECVSSRNLAEPQRAMLHYYAGILTYRDEVPARQRACNVLLVQGARDAEPTVSPGWRKAWDGARPGDNQERFWLYVRATDG
jgi:4-amino-4-deoxy-L-arabinose transferase-like glycosyltransferase